MTVGPNSLRARPAIFSPASQQEALAAPDASAQNPASMALPATVAAARSWSDFVAAVDALADTTAKGAAFEELVAHYLRTDPIYRTKLASVWRHNEISADLRTRLRLPGHDMGIDLVAETPANFGPSKPNTAPTPPAQSPSANSPPSPRSHFTSAPVPSPTPSSAPPPRASLKRFPDSPISVNSPPKYGPPYPPLFSSRSPRPPRRDRDPSRRAHRGCIRYMPSRAPPPTSQPPARLAAS